MLFSRHQEGTSQEAQARERITHTRILKYTDSLYAGLNYTLSMKENLQAEVLLKTLKRRIFLEYQTKMRGRTYYVYLYTAFQHKIYSKRFMEKIKQLTGSLSLKGSQFNIFLDLKKDAEDTHIKASYVHTTQLLCRIHAP